MGAQVQHGPKLSIDWSNREMKMFLLGMYVCGLIVAVPLVFLLVALGGDSSELWKVVVYPIAWPLILLMWIVYLLSPL